MSVKPDPDTTLKRCFGSGVNDSKPGSGSNFLSWIPIRSQGLMTKDWKKFTAGKLLIIFWPKLQFTYPQAAIKEVQATEEACTSKQIIKVTKPTGPCTLASRFQHFVAGGSSHGIASFLLLWFSFSLLQGQFWVWEAEPSQVPDVGPTHAPGDPGLPGAPLNPRPHGVQSRLNCQVGGITCVSGLPEAPTHPSPHGVQSRLNC